MHVWPIHELWHTHLQILSHSQWGVNLTERQRSSTLPCIDNWHVSICNFTGCRWTLLLLRYQQMPSLTMESPETLQNLCLNYIASEIIHPAVSDGVFDQNDTPDSIVLQKSLAHRNGIFVPSVVADLLISRMSACRTLCNRTLELFQSSSTCLRHVVIRHSPVTAAGLRVLRSHKLVSFFCWARWNQTVDIYRHRVLPEWMDSGKSAVVECYWCDFRPGWWTSSDCVSRRSEESSFSGC